MRRILKRLLFPILSRWYQRANSKTSVYRKHGLELKLLPGVFHPGLFLSTGILIDFIKRGNLAGKQLLELGAGSGLISFFAQQKGAQVTATDINPQALEGLRYNAEHNQLPITVLESDLLDRIDPDNFDLIIINPPYYPKSPSDFREAAFFCGKDFEYFRKLFRQLDEKHQRSETSILMILSEDCDIESIRKIAHSHHYTLNEVFRTVKWLEQNTIFEISR